MKKKIVLLIISITMLIGSSLSAHASSAYGMNSQGKIVFDNNTTTTADDIIFDASDFNTLAAKCS